MPDRAVTVDHVLAQRLATQRLTGRRFNTPADAVRHLLAVQAQDAPLARWSLSLRSGGPDDASVRDAVDDGTLVRTHLLRPTWHYVAVEDLRWLLALTGPKVLRSMSYRMRVLGLEDPTVVRREVDTLVRLLAGHPLTRRQIVSAVGRDDLKGERLGFVIGFAELPRPDQPPPQPQAAAWRASRTSCATTAMRIASQPLSQLGPRGPARRRPSGG